MISLVVGFLIGIIYQNVISGSQVITNDVFLKSNLQRYLQTNLISEKYFFYVVRSRVFIFLMICLLACVKWKKLIVVIYMLFAGFVFGTFSVSAVLQLGIKGILLCIAGSLPQGIFYGAQYGILFTYWYRYPERQWNRVKTVFVITMFLVGIIVETYVNPIFVKWIIGFIV